MSAKSHTFLFTLKRVYLCLHGVIMKVVRTDTLGQLATLQHRAEAVLTKQHVVYVVASRHQRITSIILTIALQ